MKSQLSWTVLLAALSLAHLPTAQAADITVDGSTCTLANAITTANTKTETGGCRFIGGHHTPLTINLTVDVALTEPLPEIATAPNVSLLIDGGGHSIRGSKTKDIGSVLNIAKGASLTLRNATISENSTVKCGGIANFGKAELINSTINGNIASGRDTSSGGGICNYNEMTLYSCTVYGNNAAPITNPTFFWGGGILNFNGEIALHDSTVSGNSAQLGGGICNIDGKVSLYNSTVSGNSAFMNGGGIWNYSFTEPSTIEFHGSIVSGNTAPDASEISSEIDRHNAYNVHNILGHSGEDNAKAFSAGFISNANNVTATSNGTKPTPLASILSPLADNGGPTKTHALVAGSPAIDLIADCGNNKNDQTGRPRPSGKGCDAGSVEFSAPQ